MLDFKGRVDVVSLVHESFIISRLRNWFAELGNHVISLLRIFPRLSYFLQKPNFDKHIPFRRAIVALLILAKCNQSVIK